jgi:hypothetical protein
MSGVPVFFGRRIPEIIAAREEVVARSDLGAARRARSAGELALQP